MPEGKKRKTKRKLLEPDYFLFADGSSRMRRGKNYASFGGVIVNAKTGDYAEFGGNLGEGTNIYAEAAGVLRGLRRVAKTANGKEKTAVVVTDSKFTIEVFTRYIPHAWDTSRDGDWRTATGKPVKNQDVYRKTLELMKKHPELKIRFVHVNSHLDMDKQWKKMESKLKSEGVVADRNVSQLFIWLNGRADAIAQEISLESMKREEWCGPLRSMPLLEDIF